MGFVVVSGDAAFHLRGLNMKYWIQYHCYNCLFMKTKVKFNRNVFKTLWYELPYQLFKLRLDTYRVSHNTVYTDFSVLLLAKAFGFVLGPS